MPGRPAASPPGAAPAAPPADPAPAAGLGESAGAALFGEDLYDRLGCSLAGAGDVNGDGFGDFILGAAANGEGGYNAGAAYVIFGKAGGIGPLDLAALDPADGFKILGDAAYDRAGLSVSAAGDVDGDGFDDLLVGAPGQDGGGANAGAAYLLFGRQGGGDIDLGDLADGAAIRIQGAAGYDYAGYGISSAGDVNGDGFDDIAVGAYGRDGLAGAVYLVFGSAARIGPLDLADLDPADGVEIAGGVPGAKAGIRVAAAGDLNGDGFGDVAIGADGHDGGGADAGIVYVILGRQTGFATIDLADLGAADGFTIQGEAAGDRLGLQIAGAGDVNADGYDDLILGAFNDSNGDDAGAVYVIFGRGTGFGPIDLANLDPADGVKLEGAGAGDAAGIGIAGAGDVNGDGFDDLLVGAFLADGGGIDSGAAYVVFGRASGWAGIDLASLGAADGFRLDGDSDYDHAGASVAGAGDLDGDGYDDLLVGAPDNSANGSNAGAAYIVYGAPAASGGAPPTLDLNGPAAGIDFSAAYTEGGPGAAIGEAIIVTAPNGPIASATIAVSDAVPGDRLAIHGTLPAGILAGGVGSATLVLSGPASASAYETALAMVRYESASDDPTAGGADAQRTVTIVVDDGSAGSEAATATLLIAPVNDAPIAADDILAAQQDSDAVYAAATLLGNDLDPDGPALFVAAVQNPVNGSVALSGGTIVFTPDPGFSGDARFDYVVSDGILTDIGQATVAVAPTPNRPPQLADPIGDRTSPEDAAISFAVPAGAFLDPDGDTLLYGASLADGLPLPGWLGFDPGTRTFSGTPPPDFNGTIALKVTASDGAESASDMFDLVIEPVNDAPSGADATIMMSEDGSRPLAQADFGFADPAEGDDFAGVVIATLPANGVLLLNDVAIGVAGTFVTAAQILAGELVFHPDADGNGSPYASFAFQLRDDGGIASGGQDTDQSANILTFDVGAINDGPVNNVPAETQMFDEDGTLVFSAANGNAIGVADVDADPGDVTVTLQIADGALTLATVAGLTSVTGDGTSDVVLTGSLAEVEAALDGLAYAPPANANGGRNLTVSTSDNGNSGPGGAIIDTDMVAITINPVNDAPSGAGGSVTGSEDDPYVFTAADFNFSDPVEGHSFLAVQITTLPAAGDILLNGAAVLAGDFIAVSAISAGMLTFQPDPDGFGAPYTTFTFRVQDGGGVLNGGVDTDPTPRTMTITVTPDNLAPEVDLNGAGAGLDAAVSYTEDAPGVSIGSGIAVSDPNEVTGDLIESATITLTDAVAGDALTVSGALPGGIIAVTTNPAGQIVVTLSGAASTADYAAAIAQILYSSSNQDPTLGGTDPTRTITVTVNDGLLNSAVATSTVTITPLDDAAVAQPDAFTTDEATTIVAGNVFAANPTLPDADPDGPPLQVGAVNGLAGNVGVQITLASGALLTLNANGTFNYNPNGQFNSLPGPASGASNLSAPDTFTYTLVGGNTVMVTITVTGVDSNGDILLGTPGVDSLDGGIGADTLSGGPGGDVMAGGPGHDLYIFDDAGDAAIEAAGGGTDIIYSAVSHALDDESEVESLSTITWELTDPLRLAGNALDNHLIGNAGANELDGGAGDDVLIGREGDDAYIVDSAGDWIVEASGGGADVVRAAVSYRLHDAAEVESLWAVAWQATDAIDLTGNALDNRLVGNAGANQLDGGGGDDVMEGLGGGDIYLVDSAADLVLEEAGAGYDVIYSAVSVALDEAAEVEGLSTITWELTDAIDLTGNALDNYLIGNAGENTLDGGAGNDVLQGREGADTYQFTALLGPNNIDLILGFSSPDDTIALDNNGIFTGLSDGALPTNAFVIGSAAQDADDRIVYDQATGRLFFDADGSGGGAQVQFAVLDGAPIIAANDFTVI